MDLLSLVDRVLHLSGFMAITWQHAVMLLLSFFLLYLAIHKKFEPLLLLPIAFGILLANLPQANLMLDAAKAGGEWYQSGVLYILYSGVKSTVFPCLIFLCVGAMTDFGPLIANPLCIFMGAGAQFGIYAVFFMARASGIFTMKEAAAISIVGGADGPTAIFAAISLAPDKLAAIAIAAYSYMALIPMIQPPVMRLLTTEKERRIKMKQAREVSRLEKIVFPIFVTVLCVLLLPSVAPLLGMLMLGNLFRESGVVKRLQLTAENELCNILIILLGLTVGATADGDVFLRPETLLIILMGLAAFILSTVGGLLIGKLLCLLSGGKINPLIGSAGVSAVPMAARVSQIEGARADPSNYLLMHAMGPNVAGVIGSAVAAGFFLTIFG